MTSIRQAGAVGTPAPAPHWPPPAPGTWVLDLDGVVWLTGEAIAGAPRAIAALRASGNRVLFATNNSALTTAQLQARLARIGVEAEPGELVSSAEAAAGLVTAGERVLALADAGVREALGTRGARLVDEGPADAVVVGWTRAFDFDRLAAASAAVRDGARLIGTNDDPTHPTPHGLMPGCGSILAAVRTASGRRATVAGKPYRPMTELIRGRRADVAVVVGDRPSTDGRLARQLGVPFALVLSGVTPPAAPAPDPPPASTAADLWAVVSGVLGT